MIKEWTEIFGAGGITLMNGTYTGEFMKHVVEYMHENHLSLYEIATLFRILTGVVAVKGELHLIQR